jgi:hypothetical protein
MAVEGVGVAIITLDVLPEFNRYRAERLSAALTYKLQGIIRAGQDASRLPTDPQFGYSIAPIDQYLPEMAAKDIMAAPSLDIESLQRDIRRVERALNPLRWPKPVPGDVLGIYTRYQNLIWNMRSDDMLPPSRRPPLLFGVGLLVVGFVIQFAAAWPKN